jgi:hypothetical protein
MGFLYRLDFASGKRYVGITEKPRVGDRMNWHSSEARLGSTLAVHRAWRKYGAPRVTVLAKASGAYLLDLERRAVHAYGTYGPGGYNLTTGGNVSPARMPDVRAKLSHAATGRRHSPETRAKLSTARKGKPLSSEHCAKISEALRHRVYSAETLARRSAAFKGRLVSVATREKLSSAVRAAFASPEARAKLSLLATGRKHSVETRARMSLAHTGKRHSAESRAKISSARRALFT